MASELPANDDAAAAAGPRQTEAEYMELYAGLQAAAAAEGPSAATAPAAATAAAAEDDDSDNDSDVDGCNSRFVFPGLAYPPSLARVFALSSWVPLLRAHTIPTRFVPLSPEFVAYLQEEGVWIPDAYAPVRADDFLDRDADATDDAEDAARWSSPVIEEIDSSDSETDAEEAAIKERNALRATQPFFPELVAQLTAALTTLGGSVFPSLDWRAPTDAAWIMTERVARCTTIGDLLLMLKSSDKVQRELEFPFDLCSEETQSPPAADAAAAAASSSAAAAAASSTTTSSVAAVSVSAGGFTPTLALRKWSTLHPSKLFRCFVYRRTLLAMCQIDPNFYEFLQKADVRDDIQDAVEAWLEDDVAPQLSKLGLEHAVLDVYIDLNERVWLVKLKPFWPRATRALLFSWKEIHQFAIEHDRKEAAKPARAQELKAGLVPITFKAAGGEGAASASAAAAAGPSVIAWPSADSLSVPFRVIPSAAAGLDILRTVDSMSSRFPVEGFDVSDSAAIDRWIQRVQSGDLKQQESDSEEEEA